jgi:tartrate-resistant acid phosphatase type 5
MMRWHGWAWVLVAVLAPIAVSGQGAAPAPPVPPLIDSLQHASLAALGRQTRDTDSVFVRTLITSTDPQARMGAANSLIFDSTATPLLLAYLIQEKNPRALKWPLYNISYPAYLQRDARVRTVLRYLLETSADSEVVATSVEGLRSLEMRELETTVTARLLDAKKRGDDSLVHALLATEDRAVTLERGIMLPTFLRRAPAPFVKHVVNPHAIRVLAFGDFGFKRSADEIATAHAMLAYERLHRFDFGITLGDNFYGMGLSSPDDPRWKGEYEPLYGPLGIELFASFGNHDEYDADSPPAEILYTARSRSWRLPSQFYTFTAGPVQFYAIDTNDPSEVQLAWLKSALDSSHARWKVVYGHFPMYMNTDFTNGVWTDTVMVRKILPILTGRADVYMAGHYHSMQHLVPVNGVSFFIAGGGGASSYDVGPMDARTKFATKEHGFAVLDVTDTTFTVRFIDEHDKQLYTATLRK